MKEVSLNAASDADAIGFKALQATVSAVGRLVNGWLIVGGWMVRLWVRSVPDSLDERLTVDVDLALLRSREERVVDVPDKLRAAAFLPQEEPFRFVRKDGARIDLLVPPGASRSEPPRIGKQEVFEAAGLRFSFELPAEKFTVRLRSQTVTVKTPALAGALVAKAVALGLRRPRGAQADAVDVGSLLAVVEAEPSPAIEHLAEHRRRSDVREAVRVIRRDFRSLDSSGASWVNRAKSQREALRAVSRAQWLLDAISSS